MSLLNEMLRDLSHKRKQPEIPGIRAIQLRRKFPTEIINFGYYLALVIELNKPEAALRLLQRFNPNVNDNPDYYDLLAVILNTLGRTMEAGSLYQTLVKIEPENGQYWLGYAIALEHKNAVQQAIDAYKHATLSNNTGTNVRGYAENRLKILQG